MELVPCGGLLRVAGFYVSILTEFDQSCLSATAFRDGQVAVTEFGAQLFDFVDEGQGVSPAVDKRIKAPPVDGASMRISRGCRWAGTR